MDYEETISSFSLSVASLDQTFSDPDLMLFKISHKNYEDLINGMSELGFVDEKILNLLWVFSGHSDRS